MSSCAKWTRRNEIHREKNTPTREETQKFSVPPVMKGGQKMRQTARPNCPQDMLGSLRHSFDCLRVPNAPLTAQTKSVQVSGTEAWQG